MMRKNTKYILANIFAVFITLSVLTNPIKAETEFYTTSKIIYEVKPRGNGSVSQEISLTNNFSHIYPKEYQLEIIGNEINNISAKDPQGSILSKVSEKNNKTLINLKFNDVVVGKNKTLNFTINYDMPNLANKKGQIWEMAIPQISNAREINELELAIKVPINFGDLSYSSKNPITQEVTTNQLILSYHKNQLNDKPILLAFGEFQIFDFELDFTLANPQNTAISKTIPIPPDTGYQSVILTNISPKPIKITTDEDYNWLALYNLKPGEKKVINVKGQAKIYSKPENADHSNLYLSKQLQTYLEDDEYWQVTSPIIQDLTNYVSTPSQIYDLVVNHIEYNYENLKQSERLGAVKAYQEGIGVCTEFSDLFITLARANGVPARELEGFAFTENKELFSLAAENDVLHSWVEYWDSNEKTWIPADPTWAKTTEGFDFINRFDLGHFAFVIHGHSSTKPIPPGFYKEENSQEKNVKVKFADKLISSPEPNFKAEINTYEKSLQLRIKNESLAPSYNINIDLLGWNGKKENKKLIEFLPPLGEKTFEINYPFLWNRIFSTPSYMLTVNQQDFQIDYPRAKLNLINFFATLWPG